MVRARSCSIDLFHRRLIQANTGPLPPLPLGIVIRTPSPELFQTTLWQQKKQSPQSLLLQLFQTTLVSLQPLFELDLQSKAEPSYEFEYPTPDSVYRLCLQGIPFTILLEKISGIVYSPFSLAPQGSLTPPRYRRRSLGLSSYRCQALGKSR